MTLVYRIDEDDDLVFVNDDWNRFAEENGGDAILSGVVLGQPLWGFISDETTRHLYEQIVADARVGRACEIRIRCDAPRCRRNLSMTVHSVPDNLVEFRTEILSEEPRAEAPIPITENARRFIHACSWCNRYRLENDWVEIEALLARVPVFQDRAGWAISHGVCPDCHAAISALLDDGANEADGDRF